MLVTDLVVGVVIIFVIVVILDFFTYVTAFYVRL